MTLMPSELQFYQRKLKIVSDQNTMLQGENTQLRKMLREAKEFEIKYDLLHINSEKQIKKLKTMFEKAIHTQKDQVINTVFKEKETQWKLELQQIEARLKEQAEKQAKAFQEQILALREKVKGYQARNQEMELYGYKMKKYEKENQSLAQQADHVRNNCQKQKEQELESLKTHMITTQRQKLSSQKADYENKIAQLEKKLIQIEVQKDNEEFKMPKLQKVVEQSDLKELLEQKSRMYEEQLEQLKISLKSKNEEIKNILKERMTSQNNHRQELAQKRELIKHLQDTLIEKQKEHDTELFNSIQRSTVIKELQIEEIRKQIEKYKDLMEREKSITNEKENNHRLEIEEKQRKFEEEKRRIVEQKNNHQRKISELSIKLKEAEGQRQMGQTQMLINSIKDLDGKEEQMSGYQNGVVFLERQLKKCQLKVDERTRTINKLYQDINQIRAEMDKEILEIKEKAKKDKKDLIDKLCAAEEQNKKLFDKLKLREKQEKRRERESFKEKTELEQQNIGLKDLVQELQRDYKRVIQAKRGAQSSYRSERQKNISGATDQNALKKQKWLQLEKQKKNLEVIYRDREEQNKMKYQQQIDQKTNLIDKLKQDLELTKNQNQILKRDNDKYMKELELSKENTKMADYNKKMASLNLELSLTQNIYECLMKAKSSASQPQSPFQPLPSFGPQVEQPQASSPRRQQLANSIVGIDVQPDELDSSPTPAFGMNPMLMSFHGSK